MQWWWSGALLTCSSLDGLTALCIAACSDRFYPFHYAPFASDPAQPGWPGHPVQPGQALQPLQPADGSAASSKQACAARVLQVRCSWWWQCNLCWLAWCVSDTDPLVLRRPGGAGSPAGPQGHPGTFHGAWRSTAAAVLCCWARGCALKRTHDFGTN